LEVDEVTWLLETLLPVEPATAEETVWGMRGWTWDTTAETMSLVLKLEPWELWPEERLEPEVKEEDPPLKLDPVEAPLKLDPVEAPLKLDPVEAPLKLDPVEAPLKLDPLLKLDPVDPEDELEEVCFSVMVTNPSFTSLVSE